MKAFLRILSTLYGVGVILHVMDFFDERLRFSEMSPLWKGWIIFLFIFDSIAMVGLWRGSSWGVASFLFVATAQLVAYIGFADIFPDQMPLIVFHGLTLTVFFGLWKLSKMKSL